MDDQTLEMLAGFICGDYEPVYRTGPQITQFFARAGFDWLVHDGSTRKTWTLEVLRHMDAAQLQSVLLRLGDPHEYHADRELTAQALNRLNEILALEGLQVVLDGVTPRLVESTAQLVGHEEQLDLAPLPPPDFLTLDLEPGLGVVLASRWTEAQQCVNAGAHTMGTIAMGSLLEGMLLAAVLRYPADANKADSAPRSADGKVKRFSDWSLSEMINVAHELRWIDLDVKKFSHSLRDFRNLIHPYQQLTDGVSPDADTCSISWLVVQAAANDLAKWLQGA